MVAVVQYSLVCAVDRDRQLASVAHRDVVTVAHRGGQRGDHDVVRADRDVLLVEDVGDGGAQDVDRGRLPVDGDLHGLVVVGDTDRTGGHREGGNALSGMTKRSREQHKYSSGRAPRAPASDVSRGRPGTPGRRHLRVSVPLRRLRRQRRVTRVVRGDPAPAIPSTVQDAGGEGQISVTES